MKAFGPWALWKILTKTMVLIFRLILFSKLWPRLPGRILLCLITSSHPLSTLGHRGPLSFAAGLEQERFLQVGTACCHVTTDEGPRHQGPQNISFWEEVSSRGHWWNPAQEPSGLTFVGKLVRLLHIKHLFPNIVTRSLKVHLLQIDVKIQRTRPSGILGVSIESSHTPFMHCEWSVFWTQNETKSSREMGVFFLVPQWAAQDLRPTGKQAHSHVSAHTEQHICWTPPSMKWVNGNH